MNLFSMDDLQMLIQKQKGMSVSIFMPTHRTSAESQLDQIQFKNLLREAKEGLLAAGTLKPNVTEFLEPAYRLIQNSLFWRRQLEGLALFLSTEAFLTYRLPVKFDELVVVTDRFHIKPLLSLISGDYRFYVMALSQNEIRLLECTRYNVDEVDLGGIPRNLGETLKYDDPEKQLQFHTGTPQRRGKRSAVFHGHGAGADETKDNIQRYFRQIDKRLQNMIRNKDVPLVLAGVDYLFPIYKEVNSYPNLIHEGIAGNPEGVSAEELHQSAWGIVKHHFQKAEKEARGRYSQFSGSRRTSSDVKEIAPAAYHGQVELLFVAVGCQKWGTFNSEKNEITLHEEAKAGDEDMLDFAAVHTLLKGGTVYAVDPDKVPDQAALAALLRY